MKTVRIYRGNVCVFVKTVSKTIVFVKTVRKPFDNHYVFVKTVIITLKIYSIVNLFRYERFSQKHGFRMVLKRFAQKHIHFSVAKAGSRRAEGGRPWAAVSPLFAKIPRGRRDGRMPIGTSRRVVVRRRHVYKYTLPIT